MSKSLSFVLFFKVCSFVERGMLMNLSSISFSVFFCPRGMPMNVTFFFEIAHLSMVDVDKLQLLGHFFLMYSSI